MDIQKLIEQAQTHLVLGHPFFANVVLRRKIEVSDRVPTAGADAKGRIYVNPTWAAEHAGTVKRMAFLLAHETMHVLGGHCHDHVLQGRDKRAANVAMDKVINETLIAEGVGEFIEGGQRHSGAQQMTWEDLYQEPDEGGESDGPGGIGDDLVSCPDGEPGQAETEQIESQAKIELAQAAQAAKMMGRLSDNLSRLVAQMVNVPVQWHTILERFLVSKGNADYSWTRPNRRFVGQGVYLPSLQPVPTMGPVVIGVDTSGSISDEDLQCVAGHLNNIIEQVVPECVHVVYCDSEVAHVDRFEPQDYPIQLKAHGGGGTDMRKIWDWAAEHAADADCLVLFTDGYTPWPDVVTIPSLVVTTHESAPSHVAESVKFN